MRNPQLPRALKRWKVLREGSVAHRCEFHGKALARRTNAVEFFQT